jgi:hypothetical protein
MATRARAVGGCSDDPFGGEPCTRLVCYAVANLADEPSAATPSLVLDARWTHLLTADQAPNLSELTLAEFVAEVERAAARATAADERYALERIRSWAQAQRCQGILFQLEPASRAGDGSARRIGLAWERNHGDP